MEPDVPENQPSSKSAGRDVEARTPEIDPEVTRWLLDSSSDPAEFLIYADVPHSKVRFQANSVPPKISHLSPHSQSAQRDDILQRLLLSILEIVPDAVLMKAAATVAVKAEPRQLKKILKLPGIRSIHPNRILGGES